MRRIAMELPLAGVDIVELTLPHDHAEVTVYLGNRIAPEALSSIAWWLAAQFGRTVPRPERTLLER